MRHASPAGRSPMPAPAAAGTAAAATDAPPPDSAGSRPIQYAEQPPPAELADLVVALWTFEVRRDGSAPLVHHVWPDGCVSLCLDVREGGPARAIIVGPTVEAQRVPVDAGQFVCGARFWPDAAGVALGASPAALRDLVVPAGDVLGVAAEELEALVAAVPRADGPAALARWLSARLAGRAPADALVSEAVRVMVRTRGELSIAELARELSLSPRQLQRRFGAAVGLTPKEFARIRRMRSALGELLRGQGAPAALAGDLGYSDQSHLARDLRELTGLSVGSLRQRLGAIDHLDVSP